MMSSKILTVVIPVYKDAAGLEATLNSLLGESYSEPYDIVVVNDGGERNVELVCNARNVTQYKVEPNKGSYNARNLGILRSNTPFLSFIDAGVVADRRHLERGLEALREYEYVAGNVEIDKSQVVDMATLHDSLNAFRIGHYFAKYHFGVTANLFVRRAVFEKIGMFDADLYSGGDLEFGDRAFRSGVRQAFERESIVYHEPRSHVEKVKKLKRVKAGQKMLYIKYPDRFGYLIGEISSRSKWRLVFPPSIAGVKKAVMTLDLKPGTKLRYYFYCYWLKLRKLFI